MLASKEVTELLANRPSPERSALASQIEDLRLAEFARRLIYFERPETLSDAQSAELSAWMANRVLTEDESVPWMTIKKALRETDVLLRTRGTRKQAYSGTCGSFSTVEQRTFQLAGKDTTDVVNNPWYSSLGKH